ncbi:MAG: LacI family DNA-binding transcriptional regulator [Anaerolineales bacterium]|nr:LacI family DNA-binding transcriptional regulator [Anaerolineales bacterium]
MSITIRDVAKQLNLSITTVSRALDGYKDVSEETRQRVIQVAKEMGYAPSRSARQLRRQRTDTIGYIMPTSQPRFADPFFSEFIAGLGDEASVQNFDLLITLAPPNQEAERVAYQRWIQGRRVDGIVLSRMRQDDWRVHYLHKSKFPFATFGRTNNSIEFPYIGVDGAYGMRRLMMHLVEQGHQRIAFVSAASDLSLQTDRFSGYQEGLAEAGLIFEERFVAEGNLTRDGGYLAAKKLLALHSPPTAIIGANDLTAIGILRAARELGISVGSDLAVAGFDGIEDTEHTVPPLTTLNQPVYDCARRLVRMLTALINNEVLEEPHVLLVPDLIIRDSTLR